MEQRDLVLGQRVRDIVSGWEGVATAEYRYLNGCIRVEVGAADKDGKPEAFVFDIQQVEPIGPVLETKKRRTGGPRNSLPVPR